MSAIKPIPYFNAPISQMAKMAKTNSQTLRGLASSSCRASQKKGLRSSQTRPFGERALTRAACFQPLDARRFLDNAFLPRVGNMGAGPRDQARRQQPLPQDGKPIREFGEWPAETMV